MDAIATARDERKLFAAHPGGVMAARERTRLVVYTIVGVGLAASGLLIGSVFHRPSALPAFLVVGGLGLMAITLRRTLNKPRPGTQTWHRKGHCL
jgi:hypothetical protein